MITNLILESLIGRIFESIIQFFLCAFVIGAILVCIGLVLLIIGGFIYLIVGLVRECSCDLFEIYKKEGLSSATKTFLGGIGCLLIIPILKLPDLIEFCSNMSKGYRVWEGDVDGKHIKMQMRRGPLYDET